MMKPTGSIRMSNNMQAEFFAKRLLVSVPELTPVYAEHMHDNGEVLGHPLMGAVTRYVVANWVDLRGRPQSLKALLDFFEKELTSGDDYSGNVIANSFCENLIGESQALAALRPMMGPRLSATMKQVLGK